jgi:hypothetical protein
MKKRVLHLTLKKKWFDLIASGEKDTEYREIKDYWERRFFIKDTPIVRGFDEIHFRNGYKKDSPFMRVEWKTLVAEPFNGNLCYAIKLGKILEVRR